MNEIEKLITKIQQYNDNPEELSKLCLEITGQLYTHNTLMAEAELREKGNIIDFIDIDKYEPKKMSVTEAEKRAVIATHNRYGILKAQNEAIIEIINSIKTRLKVLAWERQSSGENPF